MPISGRSAASRCNSSERGRSDGTSTQRLQARHRQGRAAGRAVVQPVQPDHGRDRLAFRLRLAAARHRALAQRGAGRAGAVAGRAGRHRIRDRAAGVERHRIDQALSRHRRPVAAHSVRAESRRGAPGRGGHPLSAGRRPRHHGQRPRQPLRPGQGLSEKRQPGDLPAGAGRDAQRARSDRGDRLGRRHRRRLHRAERPRRLLRPYR